MGATMNSKKQRAVYLGLAEGETLAKPAVRCHECGGRIEILPCRKCAFDERQARKRLEQKLAEGKRRFALIAERWGEN